MGKLKHNLFNNIPTGVENSKVGSQISCYTKTRTMDQAGLCNRIKICEDCR